MDNPLLRKVEPPNPSAPNPYASLGLRDNPFPMEPGLSPASGDPRVNGSIYSEQLFSEKQIEFERFMVPGKNGKQSIVFLMDHATRRGRGIGKSAFLKHQCKRIMADFGGSVSDGKALLIAVQVTPPPQSRKFWEFCKTILEAMVEQDALASAIWRLRALSGVISEEVLLGIGGSANWPDTIGNDKWLEEKGVNVYFELHQAVQRQLLAAGVSPELADILSRSQGGKDLGNSLDEGIKDSTWRRIGGRIIFHELVNVFEAAQFTRGILLVDEVEKVVYYQNIGERRAFAESLRYCLFDADFANAKNRFFGVLLTIHPGIQEILISHWQAAGLDRFAPLAEPHAQENTIYFPPLDKKMALPLVQVYLDYFRISDSDKGIIKPFTEEAVIEALIRSGGVPGPMLRLLHMVMKRAVETGTTKITKEMVGEVVSIRERAEARQMEEEEPLPPAQVRISEDRP